MPRRSKCKSHHLNLSRKAWSIHRMQHFIPYVSCKPYALPNQSNPPAIQDKARSRLSSLMWHTRKYKYTKTLVLQNQAVPVFKHLFCITVHCFALLNIALLCITLLTLLCFYTAVTTSEHAKGWSALPSTYMLNPIFYVCFLLRRSTWNVDCQPAVSYRNWIVCLPHTHT